MQTINVRFDPADLPDWARRHPEIVRRCRSDYAFRVSVYTACRTATGAAYRRHLLEETRQLEAARQDR